MADVIYHPSKTPLSGTVRLPSSKSAVHRAILAAALSKGACRVYSVDENKDIEATCRAVNALGTCTEYRSEEKTLRLSPGAPQLQEIRTVDCGESGSTLRFVIPVFAALGMDACFIGSGRLPQRPIGIYQELLIDHGVAVETAGGLPFQISGQLESGTYVLPGNVSSQFITGLMLALPLLDGDSSIALTTPLESSGYVDLTIQVLKDFGIVIHENDRGWNIPGGQRYCPRNYTVEGDWSHAAFFLSHAAVSAGGTIALQGLNAQSIQGDRACIALYRQFGLDVVSTPDAMTARNQNGGKPYRGLNAIEVDAAQIPDLVPAISVCAAFAKGQTRIFNAGRLRLKESDRLQAMADAINGLGGRAELFGDEIRIDGVETVRGGTAQGLNDHRIVMALSAAGLGSSMPVRVTDAESIQKSYPAFFKDYMELGGIADVIDVG